MQIKLQSILGKPQFQKLIATSRMNNRSIVSQCNTHKYVYKDYYKIFIAISCRTFKIYLVMSKIVQY